MNFKDYFSQTASEYAKYRPHYPQSLFDFLNNLVTTHSTAWDCATGNGQVANQLASYFDKVYASDASKQQISNAVTNNRIEYLVAPAESIPLEDNSIDLITVAQAFHWFDADSFYVQAKRVLKPEGIIALWCYGLWEIPNASDSLNTAIQYFYDAVNPFKAPEIKLIDNRYQTIDFPFQEIEIPNQSFFMTHNWTAEQLIGYLNTWSATQSFIKNKGIVDVSNLLEAIREHWSEIKQTMTISWQLHLRVGRI